MASDTPAEQAWRAWYKPEYDISRYMTTTRHDAMREACARLAEAKRDECVYLDDLGAMARSAGCVTWV